MKIKNNTIIFKSNPEHWTKEHSGLKPNTVRYLNAEEWEEYFVSNVPYISIINNMTGQTFTRNITDVTCAVIEMQPVFIFSWDHEKFVEKDYVTCLRKGTQVLREGNDGVCKI